MTKERLNVREIHNLYNSAIKNTAVLLVALSLVSITLYSLLVFPIDPWVLRIVHLKCALLLIFLTRPYKTVIDIVLISTTLLTALYLIVNSEALLYRIVLEPTKMDVLVGTVSVIVILEGIRRAMGIFFCYIILTFILYAKFGNYFPAILSSKGYAYSRIVGFLQTTDGIYSIPLGVSATYVLLFVTFGAFLNISGAGKLFIDGSLRIAGGTRGGPAKVAVIASSLFGSISGAAVANVVSTGVFTIPLMKRVGYAPKYAGAIEAVASTGGQIMPPVMGAGAFVLAEIIGVPYVYVMKAAIIPAILYFVTVFAIVDAVAIRDGLYGLPKEDLPRTEQIIAQLYLIAPLVVLLFVLLIIKQSVMRAALWGIAVTVMVSWVKKDTRMNVIDIIKAFRDGAINVVPVAIACAAAGFVIGVIAQTGLGIKLANTIISISGGNLMAALVLAAGISLILGMGLPTVAAYIVAASVVGPPLIELGLSPLTAHLFVFYFAIISTITPPVCVAAFAAAGIADDSPMRVGFQAVKLGIAAYLIPFMFVYSPQLFLIGSMVNIILRVFIDLIGIIFLGAVIEGCLPIVKMYRKFTVVQRMVLLIGSLNFIIPSFVNDILGFTFISLGLLMSRKSFVFSFKREII